MDCCATRVIFRGVKFYWRTRNTIDVTMVNHEEQNITEVVLYEPIIGKEAPRIYFNTAVLVSKLNQDDIELQMSFAKRNCVPITESFVESIMNKAKSDFILNRLVITEFPTQFQKIVIAFQFIGLDVDTGDLICEKPEAFIPFKAVHHQALMAGVVDLAIRELASENALLHIECNEAQALEKIAESPPKPLNGRERWRIPIVFLKVAKSLPLKAPDAKIWSAVLKNMNTPESATAAATVLDGHANLQLKPVAFIPHHPSVGAALLGSSKHHPVLVRMPSKLRCDTASTRLHVQAGVTEYGQPTHAHPITVTTTQSATTTVHLHTKADAGQDPDIDTQPIGQPKRKASCTDTPTPTANATKIRAKAGRKSSLLSGFRKSVKASSAATVIVVDLSIAGATARVSADTSDSSLDRGDETSSDVSALQRVLAEIGSITTSLRSNFLGALSNKSAGRASAEGEVTPLIVPLIVTPLMGGTPLLAANILIAHPGAEGVDAVPLVIVAVHAPALETVFPLIITEDDSSVSLVPMMELAPQILHLLPLLRRSQDQAVAEPAPSLLALSPLLCAAILTASSPLGSAKDDADCGNVMDGGASFTVHNFFTGLVHWRSANKIYVDASED